MNLKILDSYKNYNISMNFELGKREEEHSCSGIARSWTRVRILLTRAIISEQSFNHRLHDYRVLYFGMRAKIQTSQEGPQEECHRVGKTGSRWTQEAPQNPWLRFPYHFLVHVQI